MTVAIGSHEFPDLDGVHSHLLMLWYVMCTICSIVFGQPLYTLHLQGFNQQNRNWEDRWQCWGSFFFQHQCLSSETLMKGPHKFSWISQLFFILIAHFFLCQEIWMGQQPIKLSCNHGTEILPCQLQRAPTVGAEGVSAESHCHRHTQFQPARTSRVEQCVSLKMKVNWLSIEVPPAGLLLIAVSITNHHWFAITYHYCNYH